MVIVSAKLALRALFFGVFCAIALILFAGRAHADDATTPNTSAAQQAPAPDNSTPPPQDASSTPPPSTGDVATTPAPAPPAAAPPPSEGSQTPAPSDAQPAPASDPAPAPQDSSQPAPTDTQSTTPPTGVQSQPTSPTPAGASGPDGNTSSAGGGSSQDANVGTQGTSVSNTGGNGSVANGNGTTTPTGDPSATGTVGTGQSNATGTNSASGVDQQVQASTTDQGAIDILQIGLIVNVGVADSNSGHNVVGAGNTGSNAVGTTKSTVKSGDAGAIGDASKTGVKQGAVVGNGDKSKQTALVVNIGIGIGNSGLNITIGTVNNNGTQAGGQLVTSGQTTGQVLSGDSNAIGDQSKSHIKQLAAGTASGSAVLTIDQRAIIVNFGTALANSGGNIAFASFDPSSLTPEESQIVSAVLAILAPFFAPQQTTSSGTGGAMGGTIAKVISGNASALGTAATTDISQGVMGHVDGTGSASAQQRAEVGNFGLALANSGFNGALAGVPTGSSGGQAQLLAAQNGLMQFLSLLTNLSWLTSQNPFAQFSQTVDLGNGVQLNLGGSLTGDQFLMGWDSGFAPDGGPIPGGVRVRQISGVLNIGFTMSDTGDNTVVAIVTSSNGGTAAHLATKNGITAGSPDVLASVLSGDASAIGSLSDVMVCQAFHTTFECREKPKPPNTPPPTHTTPPPVVLASHETAPPAPAPAPAAVATAAEPGATLPFTGGNGQSMIELAGALLAVGAAAASRRRRGQRV